MTFFQINKFQFLFVIFLSALHIADAQKLNPGYLGNTQTVSIQNTSSIGNALTGSKLIENNLGISYEKAMNKSFGLELGIQHYNGHINQKNVDYYDSYWYQYSSSTFSSNYYYPVNTSYNYSTTEFVVTPKFYFLGNGAVAPYGAYFGIDLGYGFAKIKDSVNVDWSSYGGSGTIITPNNKFESTPWKNHKEVSLGINLGCRRFVSSTPISIFYQFNFGYIMAQTTPEHLAFLDANFVNHQDLLESYMMRNLGNRKLIQFKFGLGYSF